MMLSVIERAGDAILLMEAASRRNVSPFIMRLQRRMATSFQGQGREFLKKFKARQSRWPVSEASPASNLPPFEQDLDEIIEAAALEIAANLEIVATRALVYGGQTILSQLGGKGGPKDPKSLLFAGVGVSFDLRSPRAIAYLKEYGARQVANISETTRTRIRNLLIQGLEERWSYAQTAREIKSRFAQMAFGVPQQHIRSRAELIAVTEIGNAFEEGSMVGALQMEAAGQTVQKRWMTVGDDLVDGRCGGNEAMGWVGLNTPYANGEDRPLDHPACRCSLAYRVVRTEPKTKATVH